MTIWGYEHMCAQRLYDGGFPFMKPRFAARKTDEDGWKGHTGRFGSFKVHG